MNATAKTLATFLLSVTIAIGIYRAEVWSYEVRTHSDISREAYELAKINDFLTDHLSISGDIELHRNNSRQRTLRAWLSQGSIDEDNQLRHLNHFYDPIHNRGLIVLIPLGQRSHEWGLEDPQEIGAQDFSYRDAREYFRLSLTESDPRVRERRLADTFYALGHAIHLIQDLASPPHTRNGPHAGGILGPPSVVERYLDTIRDDLKFDGYPIPKTGFTKPRDFWVETDATGTPRNGPAARGLSQIINRNFVSEGTNFTALVDGDHHPEYPDPILKTADCYEELVETQDAERRLIRGLVQFCRNSFRDPNTGVLETNPRMTTFSLFGRDLQELGFFVPQGFSLNALNAVSIGELTIPRAVGYSAGLLDYFFRGKLDVALVEGAGGASGLDLQVTNRSPDPLGPGKLTLYTEDANGLRREVAGASRNLETAVPQHEDLPGLPITLPAGDPERFVAVFEGTLGQEQGAVIGQVLDTRLEQVLEITGGWVLRTADRVYWLPFEEFLPETQHFVLEVKWGARETTLGVWSIMASDQQIFEDAFSVFELTRLPGTQGVQTTGALRDGLPVAKLTLVRTVPLSALHGLPLGTTVTLEHTHRRTNHRADLVTTTHVHFIPGEKEGQGVCAFDAPSSSFTVVPNGTFQETYDQTFPLVLDTRPNLCPGPEGESCPLFYSWAWEDFTVTETGDILLLISLNQGVLPNIHREVQGQRHAPSGILVPSSGGSVTFSFPHEDYEEQVRGPLLGDLPFLAWVNLSQRTLLAKSMADAVTLRHTTVDGGLAADLGRITFSDHPTCGPTKDEVWQPFVFNFFNFCQESESCRPSAGAQVTEVRTDRGTETLGLVGWYGAPFAGLGLDQFTFSDSQTVHYLRLDPEKAVRFVLTHHRLGQAPWRPAEIPDIFFANARRGEQAVAGLPIVFGRPSPGPFTGLGPDPEGRLVLWDGRPRGLARSLLQTATPLFEPLANQRWALVGSFDLTGPIAYLVALDGSANLRVPVEHLPDAFFSDGFTLLEPRALYNAHEGKFYAIGPSLRRMVLPLKPLQPVDPTLDPLYVDGAWWPYQIVGPR